MLWLVGFADFMVAEAGAAWVCSNTKFSVTYLIANYNESHDIVI